MPTFFFFSLYNRKPIIIKICCKSGGHITQIPNTIALRITRRLDRKDDIVYIN